MSAPRVFALVTVVVLAIGPLSPATAQGPSRVRFTTPMGESVLVHGEYPPVSSSCVEPYQPLLHARYRGTIEVSRAEDGSLRLISELSFEDYVKGIAEVPRDWPIAALKAQVVAARTYALNRYGFAETSGDWDLCATTECQVYVGMRVEAGPWGDRWVRAVQETTGQVLLYRGMPAVTYYSSTSPGRTFDVEDRFGGEALPYLRGVEEDDDGASPLSRWRVEVPFEDLARFLEVEGLWPGGRIAQASVRGAGFRISGRRQVILTKDELRDALNDSASCLAPDRYPTSEPDGYRLPQTVPSVWYRARQEGSSLVLEGRGWGHGIGMVQWGAYGKAKRGMPYEDILAAYYGGLRPQAGDLPGRIRILVAEGLRRVTVVPSATGELDPAVDAGAPWVITGGRRLRVRHGSAPDPLLEASGFSAAAEAAIGRPLRARVELSADASARLEFLRDGQPAGTTPWSPFEEGAARLRLPVPPLRPGDYEVRGILHDGVDTIRTDPLPVMIRAAESPIPPSPTGTETEGAAPADDTEADGGFPIALVAVAVALLAVVVLTLRRRKGLHRA
jgi:stage II sporulation protein D